MDKGLKKLEKVGQKSEKLQKLNICDEKLTKKLQQLNIEMESYLKRAGGFLGGCNDGWEGAKASLTAAFSNQQT